MILSGSFQLDTKLHPRSDCDRREANIVLYQLQGSATAYFLFIFKRLVLFLRMF